MKLVILLTALHAALGDVSAHRLRASHLAAHAPAGALSLLQEEPSDITQNATTVAAAPDQTTIADEKAVPVAAIAATADQDDAADVADGETAQEAAELKAEEAEANKDLAAVEDEDQAEEEKEEAAVAKAAPAKPVFDVDQIERSLINLRKTDGEASPGMMAFVEKVTKLIADMEVKVVDASKKDQKLLYDYRAQFTKCRKGSKKGRAAIKTMKKDKATKATSHRSCRFLEKKAFQVRDRCDQVLVSAKETKDAACGALRDLNRNPVSEANNCHPSHGEGFPLWLRRNELWFENKRQEYQAALLKCKKAEAAVRRQIPICKRKSRNHVVQKAMCDVKQQSLETTSCGIGKRMSTTCIRYSNCWEDTKSEYDKAKPGIKNMERDRKGEWRVLKRVKCLLDVFSATDGNVDAEVIGKCKEKTHSTTHLDLFYPKIPPKIRCPAIPAVPGQNRFVQAFYSSLPFDARANPSETCIVQAGAGIVLGRPKGTTPDKCSIKGGWLVASNGGECQISDGRRRPVKVDFTKTKYTTYKFKMIFKGNTGNKNKNPIGGIRFCGGRDGRYLTFADDSNARRWGWTFQHKPRGYWARYTNKRDRATGVRGKASPFGNKEVNMEVTLKRLNANVISLWAWKVNGVQLTRYNGFHICTGRSAKMFVPSIESSPTTKSVMITDFKAFQGSNPVMSMPQTIGDGVTRTPFTVRCGKRNLQAVGPTIGTWMNQATSLECQELCTTFSGCIQFTYWSRRCTLLTKVTKFTRRARAISGPPACERPYRTGLKAEFFFTGNTGTRMPNLAFRRADQTRTDLTVRYRNTRGHWPGIRSRDHYAARWTGSLLIKNKGYYKFWTHSDDGSHLWIDGNQVVSNGGTHGWRTRGGARVHLKAGWHRIQLLYFEYNHPAGISVTYHGPDTLYHSTLIPTEVLRPEERASKSKRVGIFGTPDDKKNYKYPTQSRLLKKGDETYLLFTVRSSNDAHVTLYKDLISNRPATRPAGSYEIVIGGWGNGRSAIRKGPSSKEHAFPYTKKIVSKDEYRKFYIVVDTKKKEVRVGKGHDTEKYTFMTYKDASVFAPRSFAVMTGWGGTAEWVFNKPMRKPPTKNRLGRTAWALGDVGKDCTETCAKQGRVCDSDIRSGFSYNKLREFINKEMGASCEKDSRAWWANDQPNFVADGPDGNQGKCLASRNIPTRVRCSGKHPKVMRWCKCSASTFMLTATSVGRRTWDSMAALAKSKGGRLMTLDEARLVLKRRGNRPFLRNRDAWAAVTNPASKCKDNMDWIQIGNRGHWTGKSHFEYHGCPGWANQARRGHWDSGYLLLAKERNPRR